MKLFVKLTLVLSLALACVPREAATAQQRSVGKQRPPNILFIVADDLRANFGDSIAHTPNLKRLAQRGVTFNRAYAQYPVCNPSRVSFLTGLRPETTGIVGNNTFFRTKHPDLVTLPQLFKQHGYFTASLGKIFHRGLTMEDARADWADEKSWSHTRIYQATETGMKGEGRRLTGDEAKWCHWLAADGTDEDQPDGMIAAEAVKLIQEKRGESWFIGAGFHKPHDPFIAPKKYFDLYPIEKIPLAVDPQNRSAEVEFAIPNAYGRFAKFTDRERREFKRAYLAGVSFMDAQVGKLLDALEQTKQLDNTVIVFIGDHGYHLGEHNWWNKDTLFELSARAPLIISAPEAAPGAKRGATANGIAEFLDLYPTLIEFAGLAAPHKLEGVSLKALLNNPKAKGKDAAFTLCRRGRSVRTDRWRYTEWDQGAQGEELYDHQHDPGEYRNLANDAQWASVKVALKQRLQLASVTK
ncbi:MAG: sulfatase [Acidobacteria bacterium]|nr:sulfatase [Acidobacteriota bacterium]